MRCNFKHGSCYSKDRPQTTTPHFQRVAGSYDRKRVPQFVPIVGDVRLGKEKDRCTQYVAVHPNTGVAKPFAAPSVSVAKCTIRFLFKLFKAKPWSEIELRHAAEEIALKKLTILALQCTLNIR